jgi:hypothetical protein
MRLTIPFLLLVTILISNAQGIMYLFSGNDSYGQGLSYPNYMNPLSLSSFVVQDNTTSMAPVFLGATLYRPEFRLIKFINRSDYHHPMLPLWSQYSFYLPITSLQGGFFGSYDTQVPAAKEFMKTNWTPRDPDYETTSIRQFVEEDEYNEGIEPHGDPDHNRQVHFLDDDEPPKRPLL